MRLLDIAEQECSLNRRVLYEDRSAYQRRGTLMGSLLSFPLLCLINAYIIRSVIGPKRPFLVNGDDALFMATVAERKSWELLATEFGLQPSPGKVYHSNNLITFCSEYFVNMTKHSNRIWHVPHMPVQLFLTTPLENITQLIPRNCCNNVKTLERIYRRSVPWSKEDQRPLVGATCLGGLGCQWRQSNTDELTLLHSFNIQMKKRKLIRETALSRRLQIYQTWLVPQVRESDSVLRPRMRRRGRARNKRLLAAHVLEARDWCHERLTTDGRLLPIWG